MSIPRPPKRVMPTQKALLLEETDEAAREHDAIVKKQSTREAKNQFAVPCRKGKHHNWQYDRDADRGTLAQPDWVKVWKCRHCKKEIDVKPKPHNHSTLTAPPRGAR